MDAVVEDGLLSRKVDEGSFGKKGGRSSKPGGDNVTLRGGGSGQGTNRKRPGFDAHAPDPRFEKMSTRTALQRPDGWKMTRRRRGRGVRGEGKIPSKKACSEKRSNGKDFSSFPRRCSNPWKGVD